jgi:hypothetical protein
MKLTKKEFNKLKNDVMLQIFVNEGEPIIIIKNKKKKKKVFLSNKKSLYGQK